MRPLLLLVVATLLGSSSSSSSLAGRGRRRPSSIVDDDERVRPRAEWRRRLLSLAEAASSSSAVAASTTSSTIAAAASVAAEAERRARTGTTDDDRPVDVDVPSSARDDDDEPRPPPRSPSPFGAMADAVRVVGDTTAGTAGASVRILGALVEALGRVVSGRNEADRVARSVGSLVRSWGRVLVAVGTAAERSTSLLAVALETALRSLEDFRWRTRRRPPTPSSFPDERRTEETRRNGTRAVRAASAPYLAHGTTEDDRDRADDVDGIVARGTEELARLLRDAFADVEGVPSVAPHVLLILLALCSVSLWSVPKHRSVETDNDAKAANGPCSTIRKQQRARSSVGSDMVRRTKTATATLARWTFSRGSLLVSLHCAAFLSLTHVSRLQAEDVRRKAEAAGFRAATAFRRASSSEAEEEESAAWLNELLARAWRIEGDDDDDRVGGGGGLEPLVSSHLSAWWSAFSALADADDDDDPREHLLRATPVSLTLGSRPPVVRSATTTTTTRWSDDAVRLRLRVDAALDDFDAVLDVKLSSLDYSVLPSTRVSVSALHATATVDLSTRFVPEYPYASIVNATMSELPRVSFKVTPLSESSGLQGVDLASLPLIKSLMRNAVNDALRPYVHPHYVSLDVAALLSRQEPEFYCDEQRARHLVRNDAAARGLERSFAFALDDAYAESRRASERARTRRRRASADDGRDAAFATRRPSGTERRSNDDDDHASDGEEEEEEARDRRPRSPRRDRSARRVANRFLVTGRVDVAAPSRRPRSDDDASPPRANDGAVTKRRDANPFRNGVRRFLAHAAKNPLRVLAALAVASAGFVLRDLFDQR